MRTSEEKTIFDLHTMRLSQLPMVDFLPADYGMPHQAFGFEVGPVCFS
jgi:collagen type V/XI/XXIV/XXVII alpha